MREKLFAGYNKEKGIIAYIEVEIRKFEGKKTFTLSSNVGAIAKWGQVEKEEHIESVIDCMDSDWILDRLKEHDCTWSDLPENLVSEFEQSESFGEHNYELYTLQDSDGATYQCDIYCCGQHDILEDSDITDYVSDEVVPLILFWRDYHLKTITDEQEQWVKEKLEAIESANDLEDSAYGLANCLFKEMCEEYYGVEGLY